jgi:hypothetical protein
MYIDKSFCIEIRRLLARNTKMKKLLLFLIATLLLASGCQTASPTATVQTSDFFHPGTPAIDWNFQNPPDGWCNENVYSSGDFYCEDGEFHMINKGSGTITTMTTGNFHDFTLQAEMMIVDRSGFYGLAFRGDDAAANYYIFRIRPSGQFQLIKWSPMLLDTVLIPWTESDAIQKGRAWNLLEVSAIGNEITLSVNNKELTTINDSSFLQGSVGPVVTQQGHAILRSIKVWIIRIGDAPGFLVV